MDALRAIKSARELAQIAHATRLVHEALADVPALGDTPDEMALTAGVIRDVRRLGAEDVRVSLGRHIEGRWLFAPPQHSPLAPGDRFAVGIAASWERYWSEATRTFDVLACGLSRAWSAETETRFRDLASRARAATVVADLLTARMAGVTAIDGHGIGITPEEPPALTSDSTVRLESGMVLVVSAAFEDVGGPVVLGETVAVSVALAARQSRSSP